MPHPLCPGSPPRQRPAYAEAQSSQLYISVVLSETEARQHLSEHGNPKDPLRGGLVPAAQHLSDGARLFAHKEDKILQALHLPETG